MAFSSSSSGTSAKAPKSPESYESLFRRNLAAEILQSYEKLSWYSFQRCESLAQTRLHFRNVIAGLPDNDAGFFDWREDKTPRPKPGADEHSTRKGKSRVSSGSAGGGSNTPKGSVGKEKDDGGNVKKRKSLG